MTTPAATRVPDHLWNRLTEHATAVVGSPTMPEQLTATQGMLEQATVIRWWFVLAASEKGMSLADIGKALDMSPEGARKLRLTAARELER